MISPLTGISSTKEKSKQNITKDIEIKNNVTVARGEWGGHSGGGVYRSYYKGHKDKIKGEGRGGEEGGIGWGGVEGWGENADKCN